MISRRKWWGAGVYNLGKGEWGHINVGNAIDIPYSVILDFFIPQEERERMGIQCEKTGSKK